MLLALLGLGFWQVQRLQTKQALLFLIHQRMLEPALEITSIKPEEADFHPATANGLFDTNVTIFVHAISDRGEGGYRLLMPLKSANGSWLMVDRGWIPFNAREKLNFFIPQNPVFIKGVLRYPHATWITPANLPVEGDWYWPDLNIIASYYKLTPLKPFLMVADASPNPGGLPVGGPPLIDIPNNHFVYAITWFGIALALMVIYGVSQCRKVS